GGPVPGEDRERMRMEREGDDLPATCRRLRPRRIDDRLMPAVHAVEVAQRQDDARKRRLHPRQVADHPHRSAYIAAVRTKETDGTATGRARSGASARGRLLRSWGSP